MRKTTLQANDTAVEDPTSNAGIRSRRLLGWLLIPGLVVATAATLVYASSNSTTSDANQAAAQIQPVDVHLSAAEQDEWLRATLTTAGRAHVITEMQAAFAGVATIGTGTPTPSTTTHDGIRTVAFSSTVLPEWAAGLAGDHFWITASYADVASGAIWAAVRACQTKLPGWLCTSAGNLLSSWAQGWGWANDHGVWAAIYWWPPHITGGRW